ncbi:unnamed protein product (mitochondrion) [Plasmodiophora brassicae]|uniref:Uncharacterized protein n=1 Tax=Plasmodiophora brassicae TaxID=37360 RepID=A0A3P3YG26_PLABS|nr:unnamed protein product [Plasmodiophora brassicae]
MPNNVRTAYKEFEVFAPDVFRAHFNKTKAKLGCHLRKDKGGRKLGKRPKIDDSDPCSSTGDEDFEDTPMEHGSRKSLRLSELPESSSEFTQAVEFKNPPVFATVYTDPDTNNDRVLVVAVMHSGASDFNFKLSDDASTAIIAYTWPEPAYNVQLLFKKELASKTLEAYHPKLVAIKRELEQFRDTIQDPATGAVHVKLPIPVQTEVATWSKQATARSDGTTLILWELKSFERAYTVTREATTVVVEKET